MKLYLHGKIPENYRTRLIGDLSIVTGFQTGTDRAAADLALELGIPLSGFCPKGRIAEDGRIADSYPATECWDQDPALRTELNVLASDATVVLNFDSDPSHVDGTPLTIKAASHHGRPVRVVEMDQEPSIQGVRTWIQSTLEIGHRRINIAGPRESKRPGVIYPKSLAFLRAVLLADSL